MNADSLPRSLDELPAAWVDELQLTRPGDLLRLVGHIRGKKHRAVLPESLEGVEAIPTYLLAEYHGLPNGYFSKHFTHGYIRSFDKVMLGNMTKLRKRIAAGLSGNKRVLDIGCGGGEQAAMLTAAGIPEVYAIDASPYMIAHAREKYPEIRFAVKAAEDTGFEDAEFDAICLSFVFHEIPPKYVEEVIAEIHRILKPNGELIIAEPSVLQVELSIRELFRRYGWRGLYFRLLAKHTHEPFVVPWQARNQAEWLSQHGFSLQEEEQSCPAHWWRATKD
jgi:ubiquinone/menaquinone biosynthesis C-methylase UbiE